jgi:glyoxylase-like metal-dependent hydrolase (beta-lactamase superfamily II)
MKITDNLYMMELSMNMGGIESIIHPTLIWDDDNVILVDAGLPGGLHLIQDEMSKVGVSFDKLDKVIVTHQDMDHIGGLSNILRESDHKIEVLAHEDDKPYIQGEKRLNKMTPERMAQLQEQLKSMPEEQRNAMQKLFQNPPTAKVDETVKDDDELPYCGGIHIIHTPGHTPGHIVLYFKQSRILIAGDLLNIIDGELVGPNPQHTPDMDSAFESLQKLTQYNIEKVITYHGGLYTENSNQKIVELIKGKL